MVAHPHERIIGSELAAAIRGAEVGGSIGGGELHEVLGRRRHGRGAIGDPYPGLISLNRRALDAERHNSDTGLSDGIIGISDHYRRRVSITLAGSGHHDAGYSAAAKPGDHGGGPDAAASLQLHGYVGSSGRSVAGAAVVDHNGRYHAGRYAGRGRSCRGAAAAREVEDNYVTGLVAIPGVGHENPGDRASGYQFSTECRSGTLAAPGGDCGLGGIIQPSVGQSNLGTKRARLVEVSAIPNEVAVTLGRHDQ